MTNLPEHIYQEFFALLEAVKDASDDKKSKLTDWERSFIADHVKKHEELKEMIWVTPRQWTFLQKIGNKVGHPLCDIQVNG